MPPQASQHQYTVDGGLLAVFRGQPAGACCSWSSVQLQTASRRPAPVFSRTLPTAHAPAEQASGNSASSVWPASTRSATEGAASRVLALEEEVDLRDCRTGKWWRGGE